MTKHTSGPWGVATIDFGQAEDEITAEIDGCPISIAVVSGAGHFGVGMSDDVYTVSEAESKANGRLLSAATDLLDACRLFVEYDAHDQVDHVAMMLAYNEALQAAKHAIGKATGSNP